MTRQHQEERAAASAEQVEAQTSPSRAVMESALSAGTRSAQALMALHRFSGNAAVARLVAPSPRHPPNGHAGRPGQESSPGPVQRIPSWLPREWGQGTGVPKMSQAALHPARGARITVQRKKADITTASSAEAAGPPGAEAIRLIAQYNATMPWELLAGDALKARVDADLKTLLSIREPLETIAFQSPELQSPLSPLVKDLNLHVDAAKALLVEIRNAEEEAKPLKEKHLQGLGENKTAYENAVGTSIKMAQIHDESLRAIVGLYGQFSGLAWKKELAYREREKEQLGGQTGWATKILTPHASNEHARTVLELLGDAASPTDLSSEVMIRIIDELHNNKIPGAGEIELFFGGIVTRRAAKESKESVEEKTRRSKAEAAGIRSAALGNLGEGKTWTQLSGKIDAWWEGLKDTARRESFKAALDAGRMTVRSIAKDSAGHGGEFPAQIFVGEAQTDTGKTPMTLVRDRASILTRVKPETWATGASEMEVKKTGLYELSASLLRSGTKILDQMKFYGEPEAVVFMPASTPEDQQIFAAISELADADQHKLREIGSELTRIIMAQSSDMGTKYVDMSAGNAGTDIHYGESGTIIRYAGGSGMPARKHEIEARRTNALRYTDILKANKTRANEVVLEYRKHASDKFPLFTELDHDTKRFYILDPVDGFRRTGKYIDNDGVER